MNENKNKSGLLCYYRSKLWTFQLMLSWQTGGLTLYFVAICKDAECYRHETQQNFCLVQLTSWQLQDVFGDKQVEWCFMFVSVKIYQSVPQR